MHTAPQRGDDRDRLPTHPTRDPRSGERGVILIWVAVLTVPIITAGFLFLMYAQGNITKLRTQLNVMTLVAVGSHNAEFTGMETLNSMAMVARAQGFPEAEPVETGQEFDDGSRVIIFNHDTATIGNARVVAFQERGQGVLSALLQSLGGISTAAVSMTRPAPVFVSAVFDYSRSLGDDRSIDELLKAFRVIEEDPATGAITTGPYGTGTYPNVVPIPVVQNAIPFGIATTPRFWLGWNHLTLNWPNYERTLDMPCQVGPENGCGGGVPSHRGALLYNLTDLFMQYKRAAVVLVGVLAQLTQYIDILVVGAPLPQEQFDFMTALTQSEGANPVFEELGSNWGRYPVWRYDEDIVSDLTFGGTGPPFFGGVVQEPAFSFDNPKNIFLHPVNRAPTRLFAFGTGLTGYRKMLKHFVFEAPDGTQYSFSREQSECSGGMVCFKEPHEFFLPPAPNIDPPPLQSMTDGAPWDHGGFDSVTQRSTNDGLNPLGFSTAPLPFFVNAGPRAPTSLPDDVALVYEYRPADPALFPDNPSGPALHNDGELSQNPWEPGAALCALLENETWGDPTNVIPCRASEGSFSRDQLTRFNTDTTADSPGCRAPFRPRCRRSDGSPSKENAVFCHPGGYPLCWPNFLEPGCFEESATDPHQGDWDAGGAVPTCQPAGAFPDGHALDAGGRPIPPYYRGRLIPPATLPTGPESQSDSVFFTLMDASFTYGGSFVHHGVRDALARCREFRQELLTRGLLVLGGDASTAPTCVITLLTDGRPNLVGFDGFPVDGLTFSDMMIQLEADLDEFESLGGRIYTWFLGKVDRLEALQRDALTLRVPPIMVGSVEYRVLTAVIDGTSVGEPNCAVLQTLLNVSCTEYAAILNEQSESGDFKALLGEGGENPNRVWIETAIATNAAGGINAADARFFDGLRGLLGRLKRPVEWAL